MIEKIKKYIVLKLGGHYLDQEERALLVPLWIKRLQKAANYTIDQNALDAFLNGFDKK